LINLQGKSSLKSYAVKLLRRSLFIALEKWPLPVSHFFAETVMGYWAM